MAPWSVIDQQAIHPELNAATYGYPSDTMGMAQRGLPAALEGIIPAHSEDASYATWGYLQG